MPINNKYFSFLVCAVNLGVDLIIPFNGVVDQLSWVTTEYNEKIMTASKEIYHIFVICPDTGMEDVIYKIKKWYLNGHNKYRWHINAQIKKYFNLSSAIFDIRNENLQRIVLIPIGFHPQDVRRKLDLNLRKNLEVIVRPPRPAEGKELDDFPHSSLLVDECAITVQNILPAIRKSILRKHFSNQITVRKLQNAEDFKQYFRLRYNVWKEMGYLPADKQCKASGYELDFTDRSAMAIGIFNNDQQLIACARLVFPLGRDSHHVPLIKKIIDEVDEDLLRKNFAYPVSVKHPFDLLECFHGFNAYFAGLVKNGVPNAEVSRVIVSPEYRNAGLGEILVDSLISMAREEQLQLLFLACKKKHQSFYEQCGFKAIEGIESEKFADINQASIAMYNKLF